MKSIDTAYYKKGYSYLCGIDEAGRGPWAGPVYCAAVILPQNHDIKGIDDSKKLSEKKRELLYDQIIDTALSYSVISISPKEIDTTDILKATKKGMQKAVQSLGITPDILLLDAINISVPEILQINLIKGDARSEAIAAASILAKVSRDRYMKKIHKKYPQYNFEVHKGYGTKEHLKLLTKHGASPIHRLSFRPVQNLL